MPAVRIEAEDYDAAVELFHSKGWTDGLPIVPPTPERVARFIAASGRAADEQVGVYQDRSRPVTIEKLAINAVMAGCLPEYFPVVIAIVETMVQNPKDLILHAGNASTGSFTYGFVVNGPIRAALGMNWRGNVLGPGNRANSTIGRAIRLVQMNVLGSIPGAGMEEPEHGRPMLDRSMMGQPAKYTGYHIAENEEEFPSLRPTHVELGFKPTDSTVTVFFVSGYSWWCAHGDKTPEAWIDAAGQYVVGAGRLTGKGCALILLPPENARLFANAGWTKADIRKALYERTRRSVAWLKREGWRVTFQRDRFEPVLPQDEETYFAISGSPEPRDLHVVVCGGPAGSWPYYLHCMGGVTRKIAVPA
jgi:hypothetical protein